MANEQNHSSVTADKNGLPTRMLRIEGERTARMFANAIRVSRIDARLRELSLSTKSEQRKQYRLGDEGFTKAMAQFEDLLTLIEKDVASINATQTGQQRNRQNGQGSQAQTRGAGQRTVERVNAGVKTRNEQQVQDKPQQQPAKPVQPAKAPQSQPKAQAQPNKQQQDQQQHQTKPQPQAKPQANAQQQPAKPAQQPKPQQASKQQQSQKPGNPNKGQQAKAGQQNGGGQQQTKQAALSAATATPALS